RPEMVRGDWIKPGATVIDVGINRAPNGSGESGVVGDVAYAEVMQVAGALTPVPGGVGPMIIACLLLNTLRAVCAQKGFPAPRMCLCMPGVRDFAERLGAEALRGPCHRGAAKRSVKLHRRLVVGERPND